MGTIQRGSMGRPDSFRKMPGQITVNPVVGGNPGPSDGDGLLLEEDTDGTSFLLLESGDYLILE